MPAGIRPEQDVTLAQLEAQRHFCCIGIVRFELQNAPVFEGCMGAAASQTGIRRKRKFRIGPDDTWISPESTPLLEPPT